jgi:hypothetical protein
VAVSLRAGALSRLVIVPLALNVHVHTGTTSDGTGAGVRNGHEILKSVAVKLQRKVSVPASLIRVKRSCLIALFGDAAATSWIVPESMPESATTPVR